MRIGPNLVLILILMLTLTFSVVAFSVEQKKKSEILTQLVILECNSDYMIIENNGSNPATGLYSDPEAVFESSVLKPGEKVKAKFKNPIRGDVVVIVKSKEGNVVLKECHGEI